MQKIIATGLTGLVGSRIVELLGTRFDFVSFSLETGVDITNFSLLKSKIEKHRDASAILHLAAFTDVDTAWKQRGDRKRLCYRVNVEGTKNLSQLAAKYNQYLVAISTDFVFNGKNPPDGGYTEEDPPKPIEWYGYTKYLAEQEIEKSNVKNCILRIAFPYKAKTAVKELEPTVKLDLVRKFKKKLEAKEKLILFSDQTITPTFIDDIAQVVEYSFNKQPEGIYHCVGSDSLSPYEIAYKIAGHFDLDTSLLKKSSLQEFLKTNLKARPRQMHLTISNKRIESEFGIKMKTLDEGLLECKKQLSKI